MRLRATLAGWLSVLLLAVSLGNMACEAGCQAKALSPHCLAGAAANQAMAGMEGCASQKMPSRAFAHPLQACAHSACATAPALAPIAGAPAAAAPHAALATLATPAVFVDSPSKAASRRWPPPIFFLPASLHTVLRV